MYENVVDENLMVVISESNGKYKLSSHQDSEQCSVCGEHGRGVWVEFELAGRVQHDAHEALDKDVKFNNYKVLFFICSDCASLLNSLSTATVSKIVSVDWVDE